MADVSTTACVNDLIRIRDALHNAWSEAAEFGATHLSIPGGAQSFSYEFLRIPQREDIEAAFQPYPADKVNEVTRLGRESLERGNACMALGLPKVDVNQTEVILDSIRSAISELNRRFGDAPRAVVSKTAEEVKPLFFRGRVEGRDAYYFTKDEIVSIWAGVSGVNGLANAVHNMALDLIKAQGHQLGYCYIDPSIRDVDQFSLAFCEANYSKPTMTADGRIHSPLGVHKAVLKLTDAGPNRRKADLQYTESGDGYNCSSSRLNVLRRFLRDNFGMSCDDGEYSMDCTTEFTDPKELRVLGSFLPQLRDMDLYLFCDCVDEAMGIAFAKAKELAEIPGMVTGPHKVYESSTDCYDGKTPSDFAAAKADADGEFEGSDTEDEDSDVQEEENSNTTKWWVDMKVLWALTCREVYSYLGNIGYYTAEMVRRKIEACERGLAKAAEQGSPLKYYVTVPRNWTDEDGQEHEPWAEIDGAQDKKRVVVANEMKDGSPLLELRVLSPAKAGVTVGEFDAFFKTHVSCQELLMKGAITREQFESCSKSVSADKDWFVQVTQHDLDFVKSEHPAVEFDAFPVSPLDAPFSKATVKDEEGCRALFKVGALTREELEECEQIVHQKAFLSSHRVTAEEAGNLLDQARELIAKGRMILQAVFVP